MKQIPGFKEFFEFNNLENETIKLAAGFIEHENIKKGKYLFRQGDNSKRFYAIIKGKISIRIKKNKIVEAINNNNEKFILDKKDEIKLFHIENNYNTTENNNKSNNENNYYYNDTNENNNTNENNINNTNHIAKRNNNHNNNIEINDELNDIKQYQNEDERIILKSGQCFGEWALIYNTNRTASAYALENCDLFYIEKDHFNLFLSKGIAKADYDKKNFIVKRIPALQKAGRVLQILNKISPSFHNSGEIIYTQTEPNENIYLIYNGECKLQKFLINVDNLILNKEDVIKYKNKLMTLVNLDRSAIAGLEFTQDCKNYKYNLVCSKNKTILYKISLKVLYECNKDMKQCLLPLFLEQEKNIQNFLNNFDKLTKKKMRLFSDKNLSININEICSKNELPLEFDKKNIKKFFWKNDFKPNNFHINPLSKVEYDKLNKTFLINQKNPYNFFNFNAKNENIKNTIKKEILSSKDEYSSKFATFSQQATKIRNKSIYLTLQKNKGNQSPSSILSNEELTNILKTETTKPMSNKENYNTMSLAKTNYNHIKHFSLNIEEKDEIIIDKKEDEIIQLSLHQKFNSAVKNAKRILFVKSNNKSFNDWNDLTFAKSLNYNSGRFDLPLISYKINEANK